MDNATPEGRYIVLNKIRYKRKHKELGIAWLGLDRWNLRTKRQYSIHGTNDNKRISLEISKGNIELSNKNMLKLFEYIEPGMEVFIYNEEE